MIRTRDPVASGALIWYQLIVRQKVFNKNFSRFSNFIFHLILTVTENSHRKLDIFNVKTFEIFYTFTVNEANDFANRLKSASDLNKCRDHLLR